MKRKRGRKKNSRPQAKPSLSTVSPKGLSPWPVWKNGLFGILVALTILGIAELILAFCGIRPVSYQQDPYVGFTAYHRLFVPADDGSMLETAQNKKNLFNVQQFPQKKSADTFRIFCLGGSTTYGRPYRDQTSFCGWLRAFLPEASPERRFEVINAGGISYASYRVALVMEELAQYRPDLFVVLTGHNEFLERRTYREILKIPMFFRSVGSLLGKTRVYSAMDRGIRQIWQPAAPSQPTTALPAEVETVLDRSVGPTDYRRDELQLAQTIAHFRFNLERMTGIADRAGAELLFITPGSNLRHMSPFKSEHKPAMSKTDREKWQKLFAQAIEQHDQGAWTDVLTSLEKAAELDDLYAELHFLKANSLWQLKQFDQARAAYLRAKEEDVCPLRALVPIARAVTQTARQNDLPLVDFGAWVASVSPGKTPGKEWFLDHVHPTIEGHQQLAFRILEQLDARGIVSLAPTWGEQAAKKIAANVGQKLDKTTHAEALRNLAFVLNWAGKTEEADRLAKQALSLNPKDAAAYFQLGAAAENRGNLKKAVEHLEEALDLAPKSIQTLNRLGQALVDQGNLPEARQQFLRVLEIEPNDKTALYQLGNIAVREARWDEGQHYYQKYLAKYPDSAEIRGNLGNVLAELGKWQEASQQYQRAVAVEPENADFRYNLARCLNRLGQPVEAATQYRECLRLRPDHPQAHHALGKIRLKAGQFEQAAAHFEMAVKSTPDFVAPLIQWSRLLAFYPQSSTFNPQKALEIARRATDLSSNEPTLPLVNLAEIHAANGAFSTAIEVARSAKASASAPEVADRIDKLIQKFEQHLSPSR